MKLIVNGRDTFAPPAAPTSIRRSRPSFPARRRLRPHGLAPADALVRASRPQRAGARFSRPWLVWRPAADNIAAMADWTAALIDAAGLNKRALVGHSMGALVALETAARHPDKGDGARPDRRGGDDAGASICLRPPRPTITTPSTWSRSGATVIAPLGGSLAPGLGCLGAQRCSSVPPGVLFSDLAACNAYQDALAAAAKITVPAMLVWANAI